MTTNDDGHPFGEPEDPDAQSEAPEADLTGDAEDQTDDEVPDEELPAVDD